MPRQISLIALMIFTANTYAEGDASHGAELFTVCQACHGERAQGKEWVGAPKLSGQHDWYLVTQLFNFRDGLRGTHADDQNGRVMAPMAANLDDQDVADVVAYILTLNPNPASED